MGTPPDWSSLTLAQLFPTISDTLNEQLSLLSTGSTEALEASESIQDFMNLKIGELNSLLASISAGLNTIAQNLDSSGLFFLSVSPEIGGTSKFINTLQSSINDTNDPNRPQFADTAYVTGVVLLGGFPSEAEATTFLTKLSTFLTVNPITLPDVSKLTATT